MARLSLPLRRLSNQLNCNDLANLLKCGAGSGERYSYLNVVVTEVDGALGRIRHALQKGRLPTRSWIRFFDDTLTNEWVGVWPDSPAPE